VSININISIQLFKREYMNILMAIKEAFKTKRKLLEEILS